MRRQTSPRCFQFRMGLPPPFPHQTFKQQTELPALPQSCLSQLLNFSPRDVALSLLTAALLGAQSGLKCRIQYPKTGPVIYMTSLGSVLRGHWPSQLTLLNADGPDTSKLRICYIYSVNPQKTNEADLICGLIVLRMLYCLQYDSRPHKANSSMDRYRAMKAAIK